MVRLTSSIFLIRISFYFNEKLSYRLLRVYWEFAYFIETKNFLLKVLLLKSAVRLMNNSKNKLNSKIS